MTPFYTDDSVTLYHGDCLDVLRELPDRSVDSVVTDPPYGLEFMGKAWDKFEQTKDAWATRDKSEDLTGKTSSPFLAAAVNKFQAGAPFQAWCTEWAIECLRVLKPGGHMLAFGGSRTSHRLASAIEDAGFEIRDSIAWLYGSGFPKSLDVSKAVDKQMVAEHVVLEWEGWGTALKPAFEPIVVARKPLVGTVAGNVLTWGTGAINVDGCRVEGEPVQSQPAHRTGGFTTPLDHDGERPREYSAAGRWPSNVVLDDSQAAELDKQSGTTGPGHFPERRTGRQEIYGNGAGLPEVTGHVDHKTDSGGASRFFPTFRYEPKAPTTERPRDGVTAHPTVKPLDLMRWLVRLVTPPGGTVLEPFAGSGTTAEACVVEGFRCIAIEREADYLPLIVQRLSKPIQVALDFDSL